MDNRVKRQHVSLDTIARYLKQAWKKVESARKALDIDDETAYVLAYEAMLKASLGLMLSSAVRPRSQPGHHAVIIEFVREKLGKKHGLLCDLFDRMRRKRNQSLYDVTGFISTQEAVQSIDTASGLIRVIQGAIETDNPQLKFSYPDDT